VKYLCETCERLIPPAGFRVDQGVLVLSCSRCGAETRGLPLAATAQGGSPPIPITALLAESGGGLPVGRASAESEVLDEYDEPTRPIVVPSSLLKELEAEGGLGAAASAESPGVAASRPTTLSLSEAEVEEAREGQMTLPLSESEVEEAAPRPMTLPLSESEVEEVTPRPTTLPLTEAEVAAVEAAVEKPGPPVAEEEAPVPRVEVLEGLPTSPPRLVVLEGAEDPFSPPSGFCPKCIAVRKEKQSTCPQCGLDYARFRPEEHRPSAPVAATWEALQGQWEHRGAHDKALTLAAERGELASLGRLYRIRLARSPEDTMAQRGREEVVRLASANSTFTPSEKPDRRMRLKQAGMGLLFFFMVVAAIALLQKIRGMMGR